VELDVWAAGEPLACVCMDAANCAAICSTDCSICASLAASSSPLPKCAIPMDKPLGNVTLTES
jgi:hypothetical protein